MIPSQLDFPARRNADYIEQLYFAISGIPFDLTEITVFMDVRVYPLSPTLLFRLELAADGSQGFYIDDPLTGAIDMKIDRSTLRSTYDALNDNIGSNEVIRLSYDLVFQYSDGLRDVYMQGILSINPGVTVG